MLEVQEVQGIKEKYIGLLEDIYKGCMDSIFLHKQRQGATTSPWELLCLLLLCGCSGIHIVVGVNGSSTPTLLLSAASTYVIPNHYIFFRCICLATLNRNEIQQFEHKPNRCFFLALHAA